LNSVRVLLVVAVLQQPFGLLHADGGTVRLVKKVGNYRISVFTSPIPVRVGPVDVSVLVQNAATGGLVSEARISVRAWPREQKEASIQRLATKEMATNKLFQAAVFELPEVGLWDVNVFIEGLSEPIEVQFEMEASQGLPRIWELAPWVCWPAVAILLFCVHKWLVERKQHTSIQIKKAGSHMENRPSLRVAQSRNSV
jgi:hypothetical protein